MNCCECKISKRVCSARLTCKLPGVIPAALYMIDIQSSTWIIQNKKKIKRGLYLNSYLSNKKSKSKIFPLHF